MASVIERPNGHRWIQYVAASGKRTTLRLGKATAKMANEVCRRVEILLVSPIAGTSLERETAEWLNGIGDALRERLAELNLIDKPADEAAPATLDAFITDYIDNLDVKSGTQFNLHLARRNLVELFGADKALKEITRGDADDWRRWLKKKHREDTVRRRCGRAKQFFRAAARKRLIAKSPFGDMKDCKVNGNRERDYFLPLADAQKVLDACPDALRVNEADYLRAASQTTAKAGTTVQNPGEAQAMQETAENPGKVQLGTVQDGSVRNVSLTPRGSEQSVEFVGNSQVGAAGGAVTDPVGAGLGEIAAALAGLPEEDRAVVLRMIRQQLARQSEA
jgi:hypothetical protein